jgi:hypothetical protein
MNKKLVTAVAAFGLGLVTFAGGASAAPADGACVAANVKALGGPTISSVAKSGPGAVSGVIQDHLAGNGLAVEC